MNANQQTVPLWRENQKLTLDRKAYGPNLEPGQYTVTQVFPNRIVIRSTDGKDTGMFPYHVLLWFGLPTLQPEALYSCPDCGGSGGNIVHVDYLDENGRRAAKNVRRECECCGGSKHILGKDLLTYVATDKRIKVSE